MKEMKKVEGGGRYLNCDGQVGLFAGNFPSKLAVEWETDCKENYNNLRWVKMYSDHCKARQLDSEELLLAITDNEEVSDEIPIIGKRNLKKGEE